MHKNWTIAVRIFSTSFSSKSVYTWLIYEYNKFMLNKVDKCFLITIAVLIISLVLPILLIVILLNLNIECLFEIIFVCTVINYIFIVPILYIILIITFIMKVMAKNKHKKDWLIILFNLITILFFGYIYFALWLVAITL